MSSSFHLVATIWTYSSPSFRVLGFLSATPRSFRFCSGIYHFANSVIFDAMHVHTVGDVLEGTSESRQACAWSEYVCYVRYYNTPLPLIRSISSLLPRKAINPKKHFSSFRSLSHRGSTSIILGCPCWHPFSFVLLVLLTYR